VVNDVYQSFSVNYMSHGGGCSVQFGVMPLCCDALTIDPTCTADLYQLSFFSRKFPIFSYANTEDGIAAFSIQMHADFEHFVIPFFEEAIDCAHSVVAIKRLEEQTELPYAKNSDDIMKSKAFVLLKTKKYDEALLYFRTLMCDLICADKINLEQQKEMKARVKWEEFLQRDMNEWEQRIDLVETRDPERIMPWLLGNERKSRIALGLEKE
jgi:hypothetical protein